LWFKPLLIFHPLRTILTIAPHSPSIDVILAEDQHLVRAGLKLLLEAQNFNVKAEADNPEKLLQYLAKGTHADVIVIDPSLCNANSFELINTLKQSYPETRILIFSIIEQEEHVIQMMESGASAYLLKSITANEMMFAITHVNEGGKYLCSEMSLKLLDNAATRAKTTQPVTGNTSLTKRELEVLVLIADGLTNHEIATRLFTSRRTVEGHRKSLIDKVGAQNTATLIRYAVKRGLVA